MNGGFNIEFTSVNVRDIALFVWQLKFQSFEIEQFAKQLTNISILPVSIYTGVIGLRSNFTPMVPMSFLV